MRFDMRRHMLVVVAVLATAPLGAQAPLPRTSDSLNKAPAMPSVPLPPALDRVLRDYEREWRGGNAAALSKLFTEDGFVLQSGKLPVRGRAAIQAAYAGQAGGDLRLRAFAFSTSDTVGYLLGGYSYGAGGEVGKFTLTLRRTRGGAWLIASDMDNGSSPPRRP